VVNRVVLQGLPCLARKAAAWVMARSMNVVCSEVEHSQPTIDPAKASLTNAV
jgi:hypothetical protein